MVLPVIKQTIVTFFLRFLILKGILFAVPFQKLRLNEWILPTGGVASGRVCPAACAAGLFIRPSLSIFKKATGMEIFNFEKYCYFTIIILPISSLFN